MHSAMQKFWRPSFDIEVSDAIYNLSVMEQVVGTLARFAEDGGYEPYLAKAWSQEEAGKVWNFTLRPELDNEAGEAINATAMKHLYSGRYDVTPNVASLRSFVYCKDGVGGWMVEVTKSGLWHYRNLCCNCDSQALPLVSSIG